MEAKLKREGTVIHLDLGDRNRMLAPVMNEIAKLLVNEAGECAELIIIEGIQGARLFGVPILASARTELMG